MKVLAAMSGGVDSAVAAARAAEAGHDVTGIHLALSRNPKSYRSGARGCCTIEDSNDARRAADVIGIPFYVWDLSDRFHEDVVEDFMGEYAAGRTPNPCLRCNEKIKFAAVLDRALALGFDAVATGHYAQLRTGADGLIEMHRAVDHGKDQSYVLGVLDPGAARALAVPARRLDQDRRSAPRPPRAGCWSPTSPTATTSASSPTATTPGWLREKLGDRAPNHGGDIVDDATGEVLGSHDGTYGFTIGQRKGLRIGRPAPDGKPRFVLDIEPVSGTVTVGPRERARGRPARRHQAALVRHRRRRRAGRAPSSCARTATSTGAVVTVVGRRRVDDRAARAGVRHRARPGRRDLRRHPGGRLGHDRRRRAAQSTAMTLRHRRRLHARRRPARPTTRRCGSCSASCRTCRTCPRCPAAGADRDHDRPGAGRGRRARRRPAAGRAGGSPTRPGIDQRRARSLLAQDLDALEEQAQGVRRARSRSRWPGRGRWPRRSRGRAATRCSPTTAPGASSPRRWPRGCATTSPTCAAGCRASTGSSSRSTSPRWPRCWPAAVPTASGFGRHRTVAPARGVGRARLGARRDRRGGRRAVGAHAAPPVHRSTCCAAPARAGCRSTSASMSAADHDALAEALEAGETVALGVVPSTRRGDRRTRGRRAGAALARHGRPRGGRGRRCPGHSGTCGLAGASHEWARRALQISHRAATELTD